eukprot:Em0023g853a
MVGDQPRRPGLGREVGGYIPDLLQGEIPSLEDHLHTLFKVVHVGPVATGIQSLMLLYQIMESKQAVSGRYYQALYTKLQDPALRNLSGQGLGTRLPYDGVTGSWPEWEAHFENVAAVNKWESEEVKLMWLRALLAPAVLRLCRLLEHLGGSARSRSPRPPTPSAARGLTSSDITLYTGENSSVGRARIRSNHTARPLKPMPAIGGT